MTNTGFRKDDDEWQDQCPHCGRFTSPDEGFYDWPEPDADFVAVYCDETCQVAHHAKHGWTDADFNRDAR